MSNALIAHNAVRQATVDTFEGYRTALAEAGVQAECSGDEVKVLGLPHALWMCETALQCLADGEPLDKYSRWLGFVQAALTVNAFSTVTCERSATRSRFHAAYEDSGITPPASRGPAAVPAPVKRAKTYQEKYPCLPGPDVSPDSLTHHQRLSLCARDLAEVCATHYSQLMTQACSFGSNLAGARDVHPKGKFGQRADFLAYRLRVTAEQLAKQVQAEYSFVNSARQKEMLAFAKLLDADAAVQENTGAIRVSLPVADKYDEDTFYLAGFSGIGFNQETGLFSQCIVTLTNERGNSTWTESLIWKNRRVEVYLDDGSY